MAERPVTRQPIPPPSFPPTAVPPVPGVRLNIAILLLWTACTAFVLAAFQPRLPQALANNAIDRVAHVDEGFDQAASRRGPSARMIAMQTAVVTLAALCGAAIASLPLGMWKCTSRGPRFPTLPGHWLLICSGGVTLAVVIHLWLSGIEPLWIERFRLNGPVALLRVAVLVLCPALFVAAIASINGSAWWRVVFQLPIGSALIGWFFWVAVAVAVWNPSIVVILVLLALSWGSGITWLIILISQTIRDLQSTTKFDWLHWTGIVVVISQIALLAAMAFLGLNPWLL